MYRPSLEKAQGPLPPPGGAVVLAPAGACTESCPPHGRFEVQLAAEAGPGSPPSSRQAKVPPTPHTHAGAITRSPHSGRQGWDSFPAGVGARSSPFARQGCIPIPRWIERRVLCICNTGQGSLQPVERSLCPLPPSGGEAPHPPAAAGAESPPSARRGRRPVPRWRGAGSPSSARLSWVPVPHGRGRRVSSLFCAGWGSISR